MNVGWLLVLLACAAGLYASVTSLAKWGTPFNGMNTVGNQVGYSVLLVVALGVGAHALRKVNLSL